MPIALLIIAMMLSGHPAKPRFIHDHRDRMGGWTLKVHSDAFAERTTCQLSRGRMKLEREALAFNLGRRARTFAAVYRIDDQPPRRASDDTAELAHMGLALFDDDLANPSGGWVRVPLARLKGAHRVVIEVKRRFASFELGDLEEGLDAARWAGCDPDAFD